jgi:hypothetical protein
MARAAGRHDCAPAVDPDVVVARMRATACTASRYPRPPKPVMVPSATGATTEVWRHGSRAAGFERWSSTTTPSIGGQGVVQGPGVVGEGPGVHHHGGGPSAGRVHQLDELTFVVGLMVLESEPAGVGLGRGAGHMIVELARP